MVAAKLQGEKKLYNGRSEKCEADQVEMAVEISYYLESIALFDLVRDMQEKKRDCNQSAEGEVDVEAFRSEIVSS